VILLTPALDRLESYANALRRGWSPDNLRADVAVESLAAIERDPEAFVRSLDDPEGNGAPIRLPDGSLVPRLPGFHRWMWDGEFCGTIGFRWSPGTPDLPPTCLGHIGYAVVPWKRGRGYATAALAQMLPLARERELPYVYVTTQPDNVPSQRVILANGGVLVEHFTQLDAHGGGEALRYRIDLREKGQ
jgi:predicted acetyltransferase